MRNFESKREQQQKKVKQKLFKKEKFRKISTTIETNPSKYLKIQSLKNKNLVRKINSVFSTRSSASQIDTTLLHE